MARQKKPVHRVQMTEGKRNIIHRLLEEYDIQTAEDIQDAPKDLLGRTIKEMMEAEIDNHLGYKKSFPCMQKECLPAGFRKRLRIFTDLKHQKALFLM